MGYTHTCQGISLATGCHGRSQLITRRVHGLVQVNSGAKCHLMSLQLFINSNPGRNFLLGPRVLSFLNPPDRSHTTAEAVNTLSGHEE